MLPEIRNQKKEAIPHKLSTDEILNIATKAYTIQVQNIIIGGDNQDKKLFWRME